MVRRKPEWLRQYESISPTDRKKLGITKENFRREYSSELRYIRRGKRQ